MKSLRSEIFTIPTAISVGGYLLVNDGIKRGMDTPLGLVEVFAGRCADLLDGYWARKFDQATTIGSLVDVTLDKMASKEILDHLNEKDLVPTVIKNAAVTQNLANTAVTAIAKIAHPRTKLERSYKGGMAMAGLGSALMTYGLSEVLRPRTKAPTADITRFAGHVMGVVGLFTYGTPATVGYTNRIYNAPQ